MNPGPDVAAAATVHLAVARALEAYQRLAELGETIADEWQYVADLVAVHSADLRAIVAVDPARALSPSAVTAIDLAIEEIDLITDPHRAIDWLSTFPQIVRVAVGALVPPPPSAGAA